MLITLDATPLLGTRTGIGRYVDRLVSHLPAAVARRDVDATIQVTTWTARGGRVPALPDGVRQVGPRVPARLLRECWRRWDAPPVEALTGRTDVMHGTNFVSPPTRRAHEVLTVHDLTFALHAETVTAASLQYRELVPRALARGAHVLTPTSAVAAAVAEHYGLADERVTTTLLGVDAPWFDARPAAAGWLAEHGLPDQFVLFVGSLDPRKNLPRLLEAHARLRRDRPGTPDLVLAGPAGREERLAATPGVHVTGWLADEDLRALVAASRLLALPSLDEGFGLPVLEALATGRPALVSSVPALLEVGGPHVVAAPPDDVDALAAALAQVLDAPDDATTAAARQDWARAFTWDACADRTLDAYLAR